MKVNLKAVILGVALVFLIIPFANAELSFSSFGNKIKNNANLLVIEMKQDIASFITYNNANANINLNAKNISNIDTLSTGQLQISNGVLLNTTTTKPSCGASTRGQLWITQGGLGVVDTVEVCIKTALDTYLYKAVTLV